MASWLTPLDPALPDLWPGCVDLSDDALLDILAAAATQCEAFAPTLPDTTTDIPESWRLAQAMQARALSRSTLAGSGDQLGGFGDGVTVFPMDWTVKNLLRPKTVPVIA